MKLVKVDPLKVKRRIRLILLLVAAALVILVFKGLEAAGRKSFCASCHSLAPFFSSMAHDTAHKEIDCVVCHLPPENPDKQLDLIALLAGCFLAEIKSPENQRFVASVPDARCLTADCHGGSEWDTDIEQRRGVGFKDFMHTPHLDRVTSEGLRLSCSSCHVGLDSRGTAKGSMHFSVAPENCFPCHGDRAEPGAVHTGVSDNGTCMPCHPVERLPENRPGHGHPFRGQASLLDVLPCSGCHLLHAKRIPCVDVETCLRCHEDYEKDDPWDIDDLHMLHLPGKQADCIDCHRGQAHRNQHPGSIAQRECLLCHEDSQARFSAQVVVYTGRMDGLAMIDRMAATGVQCSGCHPLGDEGCADGRSSCTACHAAGIEKLVGLWQRTIEKQIIGIDSAIESAISDGRLLEVPAPLKRFMTLFERDGSRGVHNIVFYRYLLFMCRQYLAPEAPPREEEEAQ